MSNLKKVLAYVFCCTPMSDDNQVVQETVVSPGTLPGGAKVAVVSPNVNFYVRSDSDQSDTEVAFSAPAVKTQPRFNKVVRVTSSVGQKPYDSTGLKDDGLYHPEWERDMQNWNTGCSA